MPSFAYATSSIPLFWLQSPLIKRGFPVRKEPDRLAHLRARPGPLPRAGSLPLPLSSLSSRCRVLGPRLRLSSNDSFFRACRPLTCRRPFRSLRAKGDERLRGASVGVHPAEMALSCARRRSAQTEAPGVAGQKRFPVKLKKMERSRPRVEAGPAFQPYARIFFAAAVTSGTTLKRSSTIP